MNNEMPEEIYVQLGENRIGTEICLRKWSEKPFEDGTKYVLADKAAPVERIEGLAEAAERELALLAEIDRLKAKLAKTEWQPIETAPMDGTRVLVTDGFMVGDAYFRRGDWWLYECGDDWYSVTINPTNWMPLPEPPTTEETK